MAREGELTPSSSAASVPFCAGRPCKNLSNRRRNRFFNNIFAQAGDLTRFNSTKLPMCLQGNVFVGRAKACTQEAAPLVLPEFDPKINLRETADGHQFEITFGNNWTQDHERELLTTERLGKAVIPDLPFERADGKQIILDTDYSRSAHNPHSPFPGPFEHPAGGRLTIKIASPRTPPLGTSIALYPRIEPLLT